MSVLNSFTLAAMFCATLIIGSQPGNAQTSSDPGLAGNWQGTLTAGAAKVRMALNVKQESAGKFTATLDLPDNGAAGLPVEHVIYADRILSFDGNIGAPSSYEGVVSRDGTEVVGNLKQGANIIPLNFTHTDTKPDANVAKPAIPSGRKLELQPCAVAGVTKDALCGQFEVYEDRAKKTGRKIKLYVMVVPALVDKPASDPIFYFQGGPGGAATSVASAWIMTQLHRTRDVVLVDQRGTGKSNPLQCNFRGDPNEMRGYFAEYLTLESVRACRAELEKIADLRLYTTTIAMADLDDVRAALGYDKINVYGGSYGSTAALSYLNFYPRHVRTVTISGVAPPSNTLLLAFAKGTEHALDRLFDDCAADEKCKAAFPDVRKDWASVVANVTKAPVTFDTLNPLTRRKQQITMTREGFGELVRLMLYVPNVISIMPLMIHQMSQGDYSQFGYYAFQVQRGVDLGLARGMQLSVFCAENVPFIKESDIEPATGGTFYGGHRARIYLKACEQWPRGDMPAKFREPIKSDLPVLMLSGELDPVTPPDAATPLLRWLPNGRQIIMRNATHNTYECQEKLARDFIEAGTAKGLDASCVEGIKRLPFLPSLPALPIPK
ncbi:MAG TPA: alpha/beta fold hydrolase [Pyrinomonadaceae bacterium]|nr:alpha/beta fold hydrolase [Pyrinomonadaceae bacterium]